MAENGHVSLEHVLSVVEDNHKESMGELREQATDIGDLKVDVASLKAICETRPQTCLLTHRQDRIGDKPVAVATDAQTGRKVWVMWGVFLFIAISLGNVVFDIVSSFVRHIFHIG